MSIWDKVRSLGRTLIPGYGNNASVGSRRPRSLKNLKYSQSGPNSEIVYDLPELRQICRDLYFNNAHARSVINKFTDYVVGRGMKMQVAFDRDVITERLGLPPEEAAAMFERLSKRIERRFSMWAESRDADRQRQHNFYTLQRLAFKSMLHSGEVFPAIYHESDGRGVKTSIGLIEADRVQSPIKTSTERNIDGVILDEEGRPTAISVRKSSEDIYSMDFADVPFYYTNKRPAVLHIFETDRPGQHRGVPIIAPLIETFTQLGKLKKNELDAGVVNSFLAMIIESQNPETLSGMADGLNEAYKTDSAQDSQVGPKDMTLESGMILQLEEGEKGIPFDPKRPNTSYGQFAADLMKEMGMAVGMPFEIFVGMFSASFSASRGAMNMFKKPVAVKAEYFELEFCAPIYREWLIDEVASGRIDLPGFFEDEEVQAAWLGSTWSGEPMGQIDEYKEAQAAQLRMQLGFTDGTQEAREMNGNDYTTIVENLSREKKLREKLGVTTILDGVKNEPNPNAKPDGEDATGNESGSDFSIAS